MVLTKNEKGILLLSAREAIRNLFEDKPLPKVDFNYYPNLEVKTGAFVTLKIDGQLRGCVGYISSDIPLFETVCDAAQQAAMNDNRFYPLTFEELPHLTIEISVLLPGVPLKNYEEIEIGKHGLILEDEGVKALLLPQVAVENNFTIEQFLTSLCEKAGLDPFLWENKFLNIKVFSATVFSEVVHRNYEDEEN